MCRHQRFDFCAQCRRVASVDRDPAVLLGIVIARKVRGELLQYIFAPRQQSDVGTELGQFDRRRQADALRRAANQRVFAGEVHVHVNSPLTADAASAHASVPRFPVHAYSPVDPVRLLRSIRLRPDDSG